MTDAPTIDRPKARKRALRKLNAEQRRRIEAAVEAMIAALDAIDGDADLEPSLGYQPGRHVDLEDEHDGREPPEDEEPSLGSFDRMTDQRKSWRQAELPAVWLATDAEHDRSDYEDGGDRERDDAEESGIGDKDGLAEQLSRMTWRADANVDDPEDDPADARLISRLVNGLILAD
jgi:hypothetical protein